MIVSPVLSCTFQIGDTIEKVGEAFSISIFNICHTNTTTTILIPQQRNYDTYIMVNVQMNGTEMWPMVNTNEME